jgi:hypothetical protein
MLSVQDLTNSGKVLAKKLVQKVPPIKVSLLRFCLCHGKSRSGVTFH